MSDIKRVVLYKHGVGHFERVAKVNGSSEVKLSFRTEEMNDVLKSLTVYDTGGGSVSSVSYDNKKPVSKLLADISLDIPGAGGQTALLASLRGAEVSVATGSRSITGQVVGVEDRQVHTDSGICHKKILTLFDTEGRLQDFDLDDVRTVQFLDENLQNDMRFLFATVFSSKKQDAKGLKIFSRGEGEREVRISYVVECPVWKTSYRVALPSGEDTTCHLQGWALVDNPQDEDWSEIELSLVSGLPISFLHDLYSPRYLTRKEIEVEREAAAGPVMAQDDLFGEAFEPMAEGAFDGEADLFESAAAPAMARLRSAPVFGGRASGEAVRESAAKVETVTQKVGELFEYRIDRPVTVLRNQSALVPIADGEFEGGKKLLYNESQRAENPFSVVDLKNTTGLTLEGGPVTVYEGEIYAGEAMMDTVGPDQERMLPYAVALDVEVKVERDSYQDSVAMNVSGGVWRHKVAYFQTTSYRLVNKGSEARKVIVEHPLSDAELVDTPKPDSETRDYWRFQVSLGEKSHQSLKVTEKRIVEQTEGFGHNSPGHVLFLIQRLGGQVETRPEVEELKGLHKQISTLEEQVRELKKQLTEMSGDQKRIRENLQALGTTEEERLLRTRYAKQLDTEETKLESLKSSIASLQAQLTKLHGEFKEKAESVDISA